MICDSLVFYITGKFLTVKNIKGAYVTPKNPIRYKNHQYGKYYIRKYFIRLYEVVIFTEGFLCGKRLKFAVLILQSFLF